MSRLRQFGIYAISALVALAGIVILAYFAELLPSESYIVRFLDHSLKAGGQRQVTVTGQVTFCDRDHGLLFVQSKDQAWRVETAELDSRIVPGVSLEVSGIVANDLGSTLIQSASLRLLGFSTPVKAQSIAGRDLSNPMLSNHSVALVGIVKQSKADLLNQLNLNLLVDTAQMRVRITDWTGLNPIHLIGAKIAVTGVLETPQANCFQSSCMSLVRSNRQNMRVLIDAPHPREPLVAKNLPLLTTVADVHNLPAGEATVRLPVRLTGVVTSAHDGFYFLQDRTGGIYIDGASGRLEDAQVGRQIVLTGWTGPGQFAPVITQPHIQSVTQGILPKPGKPDVRRLLSGVEDSNWIEIEGIVRAVGWEHGLVYLRAETQGVPFRIAVADARELPFHLIDTKVKLLGVCGTEFNLLRQLIGFYVITPSLKFVHADEVPLDASRLVLRPISEFGSFSPRVRPGHRERVQGVITYRSSLVTYIQDDTGSLKIQLAERIPSTKIGDRVEAIGFSAPQSFGPAMIEGSIHKIGNSGGEIQPRAVSAEDVLDHAVEGQLISMDGILSDRSAVAGEEILTIHSGKIGFLARIETPHPPLLQVGSVLRLSGIPVLQPRPGHPYIPGAFTLLVGSPESIKVLRAAPWWNAKSMLCGFGMAALLAALVSFWAIALRKQVRRQTSVIQTQLNEAQQLRERAESAARVKSEFLANMSHEIRTPLNGILGMTDLALSESISPTVRDYLETVRVSGVSLLQVINDVLDLSKIEVGRLQIESVPFNLATSVREAAAILQPAAAAKGLAVELLCPESAPLWFRGDPLRIRQIVLNLLGNAIKFTPSGSVAVEIFCWPAHDEESNVRLEVRDTGIGIPLSKQAALFESFTQADSSTTRRYGGTGLGLAISKHLVQMMHGSIGLASESGCGSTFWFELPLALSDAPEEPATQNPPALQAANVSSRSPSTGRVLLVEDNLVNQKLALKLLQRFGYRVHAVTDGHAAIQAVKDSQFDAVLMDCQMPDCDGYEATAAIRRWEAKTCRSRIPIIALTAHAMPGDKELCLTSGMDHYLTKPLRTEELRQALEQWIPRPHHSSAA